MGSSIMARLSVVSDSLAGADHIRRQLADAFDIRIVGLAQIPQRKPDHYTVVDVNLKNSSHLLALKEWMKSKPKGAKAIFLTDRGSRIEMIRAYAIGATDVVNRPTDPKVLLQTLRGDFTALTADASDFAAGTAQGVVAAHDGLQNIFSSAVLGGTLDRQQSARRARRSSARSNRRALLPGWTRFASITARPTSIACS